MSAPGSRPEPDVAWEERLAQVWATAEDLPEDEFRAAVIDVTGALPEGHPVALFERGGAYDSTGDPEQAVALYEQALAAGLGGLRRRRAVIQLASSRRNLGDAAGGLALLAAEADRVDEADLAPAVAIFQALCLADLGREREGLALVLQAVAPTLPRYRRSVAAYGAELTAG